MARTFDFAVLRLEPDMARGESINVGLVVFGEDHLDVRFGDVLTRARALYPDFSSDTLEMAQAFLKRAAAIPSSAKERHRVLSRIGLFALGGLNHFTVETASLEMYEARLAGLMDLFVSQPRRFRPLISKGTRAITEVRNIFRAEKILASLGDTNAIHSHKIVPDWPIPNRPSIKVDFAFKNGAFRVAQVVDLSIDVDDELPSQLFSSVVTLEVAAKEVAAAVRVFAFRPSGSAKKVDEALKLAELHATHLVDLEDPAMKSQFINDWIDTAHHALEPQQQLFQENRLHVHIKEQ